MFKVLRYSKIVSTQKYASRAMHGFWDSVWVFFLLRHQIALTRNVKIKFSSKLETSSNNKKYKAILFLRNQQKASWWFLILTRWRIVQQSLLNNEGFVCVYNILKFHTGIESQKRCVTMCLSGSIGAKQLIWNEYFCRIDSLVGFTFLVIELSTKF